MKQRKRLEALLKGDRKSGKLMTIYAFWKNDRPSGFGLSYNMDDEYICGVFADMFVQYLKHYIETDDAGRSNQINEYRQQLDNYKELLSHNPGFEICLIGNVWLLESMGLIALDDFNGMMMIWQ